MIAWFCSMDVVGMCLRVSLNCGASLPEVC